MGGAAHLHCWSSWNADPSRSEAVAATGSGRGAVRRGRGDSRVIELCALDGDFEDGGQVVQVLLAVKGASLR